jgi:hypothetical protein
MITFALLLMNVYPVDLVCIPKKRDKEQITALVQIFGR